LRPRLAWRHALGWTQWKLAQQYNTLHPGARLADTRVSDYENWPHGGHRPSPRYLARLAATYRHGCTPAPLVHAHHPAHLPPPPPARAPRPPPHPPPPPPPGPGPPPPPPPQGRQRPPPRPPKASWRRPPTRPGGPPRQRLAPSRTPWPRNCPATWNRSPDRTR